MINLKTAVYKIANDTTITLVSNGTVTKTEKGKQVNSVTLPQNIIELLKESDPFYGSIFLLSALYGTNEGLGNLALHLENDTKNLSTFLADAKELLGLPAGCEMQLNEKAPITRMELEEAVKGTPVHYVIKENRLFGIVQMAEDAVYVRLQGMPQFECIRVPKVQAEQQMEFTFYAHLIIFDYLAIRHYFDHDQYSEVITADSDKIFCLGLDRVFGVEMKENLMFSGDKSKDFIVDGNEVSLAELVEVL